MNEKTEEDQEAAVQMSSTAIPLSKAVEDGIPLVEYARTLSRDPSQRRDRTVKQSLTTIVTGVVQTEEAHGIAFCSAQIGAGNGASLLCAQHSRTANAPGRGDETWLPPQILGRRETILDLKDLVMFFGVQAGLGCKIAELWSP